MPKDNMKQQSPAFPDLLIDELNQGLIELIRLFLYSSFGRSSLQTTFSGSFRKRTSGYSPLSFMD